MNPPFLVPNSQIRIISPSGAIDPLYIDGATKVLQNWGLQVTEGKFARNEYGRFAGTKEQRIADLQEALDDPTVSAILCSRGGYGLAQLIDKIDFSAFKLQPKWLIGFSDITILHNAISALGVSSIHGIMAKHITELPAESDQIQILKATLFGSFPTYNFSLHVHNKNGIASGKVIGGNLSVLVGMIGTPFDLKYENNILFIEEIAEKPYHIDRMMQQLRLSGALKSIAGLVVGQFSNCDEDSLMMQTITEIILDAVKEYDFPVCFDFPAGHEDFNLPLVIGGNARLAVATSNVELKFY